MLISQPWIVVTILAGAASVGVATWLYVWVHRQDAGTKKAKGSYQHRNKAYI